MVKIRILFPKQYKNVKNKTRRDASFLFAFLCALSFVAEVCPLTITANAFTISTVDYSFIGQCAKCGV